MRVYNIINQPKKYLGCVYDNPAIILANQKSIFFIHTHGSKWLFDDISTCLRNNDILLSISNIGCDTSYDSYIHGPNSIYTKYIRDLYRSTNDTESSNKVLSTKNVLFD